jgi:hypothetical protein
MIFGLEMYLNRVELTLLTDVHYRVSRSHHLLPHLYAFAFFTR